MDSWSWLQRLRGSETQAGLRSLHLQTIRIDVHVPQSFVGVEMLGAGTRPAKYLQCENVAERDMGRKARERYL